jgi:Fe-S oxidoreductase
MFQQSDLVKNLFHLTVFGVAHAAFIYAVYYRFKLMLKAQKVGNWASMEARTRSFLFNVLFQQKLFKHPLRGLMHAFIFYGFLSYLVHTSSQMVAGNAWALLTMAGINPYEFMIPDYTYLGLDLTEGQILGVLAGLLLLISLTFTVYFNLKSGKKFKATQNAKAQWVFLSILLVEFAAVFAVVIGSGRDAYEAVVQNFSILVLTGLIFFAYRRWIRRSPELDVPSPQSGIVLTLISILMLSTLAGSAAQAMLHGHHVSWVNGVVLKILKFFGMTSNADALAVRDFTWWVHIMTVYAFMIYIPNSKHSHLIFAPVNFFMIEDRPRGAMKYMDLENSTVYGAQGVNEFPWTNLLSAMSCIECGRCTVQCPANRTGKPLDPKKIMVDLKHAMLEMADQVEKYNPDEGSTARVIGDPYITEEELWSCTSCYACVEACPVGNNQLEAILEMRRNLVLVESNFPAELQLAFTNMEKNSNPWGVGAHTRADWAAGLGVRTMAEDSNVDILYWVGCAASFDERNKAVARSFVKILQQANVNFAILGTEENCTGDSARRGGNEYLYQTLATTNVETLNRYGVKKIVTACPHCFNTLKNEYPQFGGHYEVYHHTDFIDDLIREKKIEMDPAVVEQMKDRRATYHDSCYLGRYNDIYDQPRDVVRAAMGADVAEAVDHHTKSLCCGAGGAQMWMEEHYERVNIKRTGQLIDTGADTIAVACPFCNIMMTDGVKAKGLQDDVKVLDVAQIVAASMKGGEGPIAGGFKKKEMASH